MSRSSSDGDDGLIGVVTRPGYPFVFEIRMLPKKLPFWMGGPSGGIVEMMIQALIIAAFGERQGVKLMVFRGPKAWLRNVTTIRDVVLLELYPDAETCERRAWEVRRSIEDGDFDATPALSRMARRTVLRGG